MDDKYGTYRVSGLTVWFSEMPKMNPFKIQSDFGQVRVIGRGNAFDEIDIYREALEQIRDDIGSRKAIEIAETALKSVDDAQSTRMLLPKPPLTPL